MAFPSMHTTTRYRHTYHVFLSFSGKDTRAGFISHLYDALKRKQILTFIDNELETGVGISPSIFQAIENSMISLIVFSENYASSRWCLDELVKIVESEKHGQLAIPIFYNIDPSHVRNQTGRFGEAFGRHSMAKMPVIQSWRAALMEAANLKGWVSHMKSSESEFIYEIVRDIEKKLNSGTFGSTFKTNQNIDVCYSTCSRLWQHPSMVSSPYAHLAQGSKRAVICGVTYKNTMELKRSVNDAKFMKFMLVNVFNFPESSILMLGEEETEPYRRPTKNNIRMALHWLVEGSQRGDSLVFYFSGHGSQRKDYEGDESDGYDETLYPTDFQTEGVIVDNEINELIVRPLPPGVKLHAIIDASHSGTMLDLPFLSRMDGNGKYHWEGQKRSSCGWKATGGGEVISFSGCDDNQILEDTRGPISAMTNAFIQANILRKATTYGELLKEMRSIIKDGNVLTARRPVFHSSPGEDNGRPSFVRAFLGWIGNRRITQEPQLAANKQFDIDLEPFEL